MEKMFVFNSVVQVLYLLPLFRDYINQLQLAEEVAMQIKNLFCETDFQRACKDISLNKVFKSTWL